MLLSVDVDKFILKELSLKLSSPQEFESEQMRPLAKAVTKTLEKVRSFLREQCLSPTPHYTEEIHENLKIFDRLFAEFEFSYVSCMVHVKTTKEFEIQQDVICLFSDTLQRAIHREMITQDMVDLYDPRYWALLSCQSLNQ